MSRPAWARGLKHGAPKHIKSQYIVAPRVGAWIETSDNSAVGDLSLSRPAWARGLKHANPTNEQDPQESRPAWARGLKRLEH